MHLRNRNFAWSIMDLLDSDRMGEASINRAGVVTNREELALIVKHRPILLNQAVDKRLSWLVKMRKVKLRAEFRIVLGFIVNQREGGVFIVQGRSRVFAFMKNATSVNAMEDDIEVVGLVGEATIIIEYVNSPSGRSPPRNLFGWSYSRMWSTSL